MDKVHNKFTHVHRHLHFSLFWNTFHLFIFCVSVGGCGRTEDSLQDANLSYSVGPQDWTQTQQQVPLYPLGCPTDSMSFHQKDGY